PGSAYPSKFGHAPPKPGGEFFRMSAAEIFLASAIEAAPSFDMKAAPSFSATARGGTFSPPSFESLGGANDPPLSEMAPWKSPLASGEAASMLTEIPPADSPKIVTRFGSPPKA